VVHAAVLLVNGRPAVRTDYPARDPLKSTVKTEQQAHLELGRLFKEASEGHTPESGATIAKLMDEYAAIASWGCVRERDLHGGEVTQPTGTIRARVPLNTVPGLYHPPGYKGGRRDSNPAWVPGNTSLRLVSRMTPGRLLARSGTMAKPSPR
jgi:hypothetical protein